MRLGITSVALAISLLASACGTVPLLQAASFRGKPISEVIALYGPPDASRPTPGEYVWTTGEGANESCSMHVSTDSAGVVTGVIMNGDGSACSKLRQRRPERKHD
jgi:hypothetical protein